MDISIKEITQIYSSVDQELLVEFQNEIENCRGNIIGLGAGRMGYSLQAFIMRLSHLGYRSFMIGDTTLPRIDKQDLVIVNSSSGNTPSIVLLCETAKKHGSKILALTSDKNSKIAALSDTVILYSPIKSEQLMKTVYEQFSYLLFDNIALNLSHNSPLSLSSIEKNHSVLE